MWGPLLRQLFFTYGIRYLKTGFHAAKQVYDKTSHSGEPFMARLWKTADTITAPPLMDKQEAIKVLNLKPNYQKQDILEQYDHLMRLNDPVKGGSFYFQCKVMGAKKVLLEEV
mmetsp:Transcript_26156/g.46535  ORF Transcript_26156/g.46535 Transcript_26156/m.46535 type:complete len:113 (-) Transcript_26156:1404-1742(-)|eukprot:CAMPEP_0204905324 /NCGR_PEP_ID=MMETSP1397-20131031/5361_1 /ASSEMBLY_ACC=CAM_ASM_000891 /TAXON_ID=49980 /ORGANISM="Climacostomum Climacostomum virens, Strain Stock W-24" /LENGTH=112 /DNA_ID=CAMNT_0052074197 /DNA_START=337 /DNA_END=675 /DNA_ORIENTATION=-